MTVKAIRTEWFQDYKYPSMFIAFPSCTFKCEKDCGKRVCQNSALANSPDINIDVNLIIERYINNPITKAIVCGGLDPFDGFDDLYQLITKLRYEYLCEDTIVIYTGYKKEEVLEYIQLLTPLKNIVIKFGRYIPMQTPHYDDVLGVKLASDNQYAEKIC